jgi:hypothetical protein
MNLGTIGKNGTGTAYNQNYRATVKIVIFINR